MEEQSPRAALITGGTVGLGKAVAMELARRGWSVFLQHTAVDSLDSTQQIQAIADEIDSGGEVAAAQADLTIADDREQLVEQALEVFGRIDLLVNAAGSVQYPQQDILEVSEDSFRDVLDAGVTATLFLTQRVANEMVRLVEAGQIDAPRIVTLNSVCAYAVMSGHAPQCVSRSGLRVMTGLFADRLAEYGINVYEVCAGIIAEHSNSPAGALHQGMVGQGRMPIRRTGRPIDIALAVAAIAEGYLSFSTGEVINVDGGFHLRRF